MSLQVDRPVNVALIGAGLIGAFHAESLARRIPGARLAAVADALPGRAEAVARQLGCPRWATDYRSLLADSELEAVVVATTAQAHVDAIVAAAGAGKAVFCEKPIAHTLQEADRAITACRAAGVPLQIGFQRRFDAAYRAAHHLASSGALGSIQLLRSITRDPELDAPDRIPPWAIFLETLIHDFDVLRWLCGAEPVEVFATAGALVRPDLAAAGLRDTAVVTVRFANGALATADASFQAVYGYDVRAEVFGSAGMATAGDGRTSSTLRYGADGISAPHTGSFIERFGQAYTAELAHFAACVRAGTAPACTGEDGRAALAMALAAIQSAQSARAVPLSEVEPVRAVP